MAKKTRDQYVAEMLAMRPRLKVAVWQPRLEGVYDNTMECFNKSRGPCGKCGKETNGHTSHMSMGKFAYCIGCEPPGSDFGRKDAA
jgi:7-cyano-7-deazaguanine synthase in queuosine biosynthesis